MTELKDVERVEGATRFGFHFLSLFHQCPRRFLYEKLWGYAPVKDALPLVLGKAFHAFKEHFYRDVGSEKALAIAEATEVQPAMLEPEERDECLRRLRALAPGWVGEYGAGDLESFKILGVEEEFAIPLEGTPYIFTGRFDARVSAIGEERILETKQTGGALVSMRENTAWSYQVDAYCWAHEKVSPMAWRGGVVIDVASSYDGKKGVTVGFDRQAVNRAESHLTDFETWVILSLMRIAALVERYTSGELPDLIFERNPSACSGMVACPFRGVCRDLKSGDCTAPFLRKEPSVVRGLLPLLDAKEVLHGL